MSDNEQIAHLGLLINRETFLREYGFDLVLDQKQSSQEFYKYYKNRRRCFAPKILIHIFEKYPNLNFYISKSELSKNIENNNIYHEITLDFNLQENHSFNISDVKGFVKATFLNFNKTEDKNILSANFNYLRISANQDLINLIKNDNSYLFAINFGKSKADLILEKLKIT